MTYRKAFIIGPSYEPMAPFRDEGYITSDIETQIQSLFEDTLKDRTNPQIVSAQSALVTQMLEGAPYLVCVTTIVVEWEA